jgi:glycosyltransferase involved in cell wall biosynthesis
LPLSDKEDERERANTRYTLKSGLFSLVASTVLIAVQNPVRFLKAAALAFQMSRRAERGLPYHLAYLAQACMILPWLSKAGVGHVHAHFGTNSAEVAMFVHELGGPTWSFTVHGPEEFDKKFIIGLAEKVRRCTFVVAISSFGRAQIFRLIESQLWPKVRVVHCSVDADFAGDVPIAPPVGNRLVCVGRLCEQKGQLLLLQAAKEVLSEGHALELVFAGDGDMRAVIEQEIERLGLTEAVRLTGWQSGPQVRDLILASRALVLPSFAEGLPVSIMEAMSLARPVITTYVAGIPELVQRDQGWLIPAGDVAALARAMAECLETDAGTIEAMGASARTRVFARHDAQREAAKLLKMFYECAAPRS